MRKALKTSKKEEVNSLPPKAVFQEIVVEETGKSYYAVNLRHRFFKEELIFQFENEKTIEKASHLDALEEMGENEGISYFSSFRQALVYIVKFYRAIFLGNDLEFRSLIGQLVFFLSVLHSMTENKNIEIFPDVPSHIHWLLSTFIEKNLVA